MTVALWAINGIGLGHTARVCALASMFLSKGCRVKLLFEHEQQVAILGDLGENVEVEFALRPWKHSGSGSADSAKIRRFLSDCSLVIADMASVPPAGPFFALVKEDSQVVFILRWMSHRFLAERVLERWKQYGRGNVVVVLPESLFRLLLGEPFEYSFPRFWFAPGFIFRSQSKLSVESNLDSEGLIRIALTCGAGGVHSARGTEELRQVLWGIAEARAMLPANAVFHAWVGSNDELESAALSCGAFDFIASLQSSLVPDWSQYHIIIARPSFNTMIEIMQTAATVITGHFESDGEWVQNSLRWFEEFGVRFLQRIEKTEVTRSIIDSAPRAISDGTSLMQRRRLFFRDATEDVVEHCLSLVR